jgi:hypothetical protein
MNELIWEDDSAVEIKSLQELNEVLINLPLSKVDQVIAKNKEKLISWIEENYPKRLEILAHFKENMTSQQLRERLVRDLKE